MKVILKMEVVKRIFFIFFCILIGNCSKLNNYDYISTQEVLNNLDNKNYIFIDSRNDSFYNGFKEVGANRGGHIKGAIQFTTSWLNYIDGNKFEPFAYDKGINKNKILVLYGTNQSDLNLLADEFLSRNYKVKIYKGFIEYANNFKNPMEKFKNFHYLVSANWLKELIDGNKPETYVNNKFAIYEVSWGKLLQAKDYKIHIPGAIHFNTDLIEKAPNWNLRDFGELKNNLLELGITQDKTIILYSNNKLAAGRVMWALIYLGVKDVRLLNGGFNAWKNNGFKTEKKANKPIKEINFGINLVNKKYNISFPKDAFNLMKTKKLKLVSIRSWDEHIGKVSGYDYIPKAGEPKGAIFGFSGVDAQDLSDYYDPDETIRNPKEIFALWKEQGIIKNDFVAFYCGTGWRAGIPWLITQIDGWENSAIYDGGWNMWQMDKSLPVQKGILKNIKKPNSKNNYKKIIPKGGSCKS